MSPLPDLALSRAVVDRDAGRRTDTAWLAAAWADPATRVLVLRDGRAAGHRRAAAARPRHPAGRAGRTGASSSAPTRAPPTSPSFDAGPDTGDEHAPRMLGLREVGAGLDDLRGRPGRARGVAGQLARDPPALPALRCGHPAGERRPHPALRRRRQRALPAHRPGGHHAGRRRRRPAAARPPGDAGPKGRFSTLAGFVEPGESLEAAVRREVHEEVGVEIGTVTYLGSQPWPFPSSLMLGFTAQALTTEVHRHDGEIAEARWYTRAGLLADIAAGRVHMSPSISISRRLIEHWYGEPLPSSPEG